MVLHLPCWLQVLSGLAALPPAQPQPGQQRQLPHSHWLHWTQLPADDFPAAAIPAAAGGGQQVLPGACDLSCLVRSLVQQLSDAVSAAFVMAPARRPSPAAAAAGSAATPCPAAVDAAAADDISRGPASSSSISQQQQEQQQQRQSSDVQAAAKQIVARVRASSGSQHAAWVEELLAPMLVPNWRQKQQTFLRLVSSTLWRGQVLVASGCCLNLHTGHGCRVHTVPPHTSRTQCFEQTSGPPLLSTVAPCV